MKYFINRLSEASTWRGIFAFLTGIGIAISPDQAAAYTAAGLAIIGLIGTFAKDKGEK